MTMLDRNLPALVVDDSRVMGQIMCRVLRQIGFAQVDYVTEGLDALLKLRSARYGMALIDLNMNPISGTELIRLIWMDEAIPPLPVVLTSANHSNIAKAVADAERELADVYILKPFTAEALDRKLKAAFGESV